MREMDASPPLSHISIRALTAPLAIRSWSQGIRMTRPVTPTCASPSICTCSGWVLAAAGALMHTYVWLKENWRGE
jgi:hypothetical protein